MYLRKSIRSYKGGSYTNYLLVESIHTAKGPRQKTVCSLGDLGPRPRAEWLKLAHKIEDGLIGQADLLDPADGEAWLMLGAAYQSMGKNAEARRTFSSCAAEAKRGPINECRAMLR